MENESSEIRKQIIELLKTSGQIIKFDPLNVNMTTIKPPNYDKHQVYECLECGKLTTDPPKHELRYHR